MQFSVLIMENFFKYLNKYGTNIENNYHFSLFSTTDLIKRFIWNEFDTMFLKHMSIQQMSEV